MADMLTRRYCIERAIQTVAALRALVEPPVYSVRHPGPLAEVQAYLEDYLAGVPIEPAAPVAEEHKS
jgi:hypothetical protein